MTDEQQMETDSQDEFWNYVNELAEQFEVTSDYILEEFLV